MISKLKRIIVLPLLFLSLGAFANPTQIGFAIDGSGSVGNFNFGVVVTGLSEAFKSLPTDSSVEVTIVQFASGTRIEIPPTLIDSEATRNQLVTDVSNISRLGGLTATGPAIRLLVDTMATGNTSGSSIINVSTDGFANVGESQLSAAMYAQSQGIDALTAEGITGGADINGLQDIVYGPNTVMGTGTILLPDAAPPNPLTGAAWVVPVTTFQAFGGVVSSKIQAITQPTTVPEPGTLSLLGLGLLSIGGLTRRRQKRLAA